MNAKSQELREGGGTGIVMRHRGSRRNPGAVGVQNSMKGMKRDDLIREYKGQQSYEVRQSLMDEARRKYDERGVYEANQTNVFR